MIGNGVPDLISFNRMTRLTTELKTRMDATSEEAVTGKHADIAGATGARIGEAQLVKKGLDDIENRAGLYGMVGSRIDTMLNSLGSVRDAVGDIGTEALSLVQMGNPNLMKPVADQAQTAIQSIFTMMNVGQGSRTLFAGDATQTTPLQDSDKLIEDVRAIVAANADPADLETALDDYFNDPAGGFQTDIYQGGDFDASSLTLSNGARISYSMRADDQSIRDTLRGLAVLATTEDVAAPHGGTEYKDIVGNAVSSLERGREGILNAEARIGTAAEAIARAGESDAHEKIILTSVYQSLVGRDQYEAAAELKLIETQLESSYILTSRLSSLNLTNFLR